MTWRATAFAWVCLACTIIVAVLWAVSAWRHAEVACWHFRAAARVLGSYRLALVDGRVAFSRELMAAAPGYRPTRMYYVRGRLHMIVTRRPPPTRISVGADYVEVLGWRYASSRASLGLISRVEVEVPLWFLSVAGPGLWWCCRARRAARSARGRGFSVQQGSSSADAGRGPAE